MLASYNKFRDFCGEILTHLALVVVRVHPGTGVGRQEGGKKFLAHDAGVDLLQLRGLKRNQGLKDWAAFNKKNILPLGYITTSYDV